MVVFKKCHLFEYDQLQCFIFYTSTLNIEIKLF